ncbi:hypothetical protein [Formosa sp. PL04]|uniref:hypothetical protein n=1 Tax=Formosa sp. PL04 TaxID=3081755 RepID=UPI0029813054|nr:hypothetical protein [Formosa sp. PL04]MDW5287601.1 hypothetical protein [Formosa sp. PL04]
MKTFISIALCLLCYNSIRAQNTDVNKTNDNKITVTAVEKLEIPDVFLLEKHNLEIKTTGTNANYLNLSSVLESSRYVRKLQTIAAGYDIKTSEVYTSQYDSEKKPIYHITMKTKEGRIRAYYNGKGEIKKASERYTNVAIPTYIVIKIMKDYPDWKVTNQLCEIDYQLNKESIITYEVKLMKGNKKKTIDLDANGNIM